MNTPHETIDSIERSAYDSAMSGEVKERWEEFEQNFPTKMQVIEKGIYKDSWRFTSYFKDTFSKFIRTQRSLAQQEILDSFKVEAEMKMLRSNGSLGSDYNKGLQDAINILSTLKDTNI